jgi:hypothetical protein
MHRSLTVAAAALTILTALSSAAPAPKDPKAAAYFPTTVGTKWVYEEPGFGESVHEVTAVETKGEATLVTVSYAYPGGRSPEPEPQGVYQLRVTADGLYELPRKFEGNFPPRCALKLPFAPGKEWEWSLDGGVLVVKYKATGPEEVKVPAGSYKAARVDCVLAVDEVRFEYSVWYAPGVGVVKRQSGNKGVVEHTTVLKSFTPGKD